MAHALAFLTLFCMYFANAAVLTESQSAAAFASLEKKQNFADSYANYSGRRFRAGCKAATVAFNASCENQLEGGPYARRRRRAPGMDEAGRNMCMPNGSNANNSRCCKDGEFRCELDDAGNKLEFECCDDCFEPNPPPYCLEASTAITLSVCGTKAGRCSTCMNFPGRSDAGSCTSSSLTLSNGTTLLGSWVETNATEEACEAVNYCGQCVGLSSSSAELDCVHNSGNWSRLPGSGRRRDACQPGHWVEVAQYNRGDTMPAAPLSNGSGCSTGPRHTEPSHIISPMISAAKFLADAEAGLTVEEAIQGNATYYHSDLLRSVLGNAGIINHRDAVERAEMIFSDQTGLVLIKDPINQGKITVNGTSNTFAIILRPTNYAEADAITFLGGNVAVIGGSSAGAIVSSSTGKIEIMDLVNSGPVNVSGSRDIFIARVANKATIAVSNVDATLYNVTNEGRVTVSGGGTYRAYNIINSGSIVVEAGDIELSLVCPSPGTVTMKEGVTGKVSFDPACPPGNLSIPASVTQYPMTCASVGKMYMDSGCCGYPSKPFNMNGRRLSQVQTSAHQLQNYIEIAITEEKIKHGEQSSRELAANIVALAKTFLPK